MLYAVCIGFTLRFLFGIAIMYFMVVSMVNVFLDFSVKRQLSGTPSRRSVGNEILP